MGKTDQELLLNLHEKIDDLKDKVHSIDITVSRLDITSEKQERNLDDHMARTAINEKKLELFENKMIPALDAYKFVATFCKFAAPAVTLLGIYYKYFR